MLDDLSAIQSRIQEIQGRIAALSAPPPAAPAHLPAPAARRRHRPPSPRRCTRPRRRRAAGRRCPGVPRSLAADARFPGRAERHAHSAATAVGGYDGLIQTYAAKHGLAPELVRAVIHTESGGNPRAVSPAGAMGLMQLMPENVKDAGIADPFDPEQNIAAGTRQLSDLMQQYHGNLDLALAGYNAGPGNVRKYGGVPPFAETQGYIRKVRAAMGNE